MTDPFRDVALDTIKGAAIHALLTSAGGLGSSTLVVDKAGDDRTAKRGTALRFKTVQAAIDAAKAGDVVLVCPSSTPYGAAALKRGVSLRGVDARNVVLGAVSWTPVDVAPGNTDPQHALVADLTCGALTFDGTSSGLVDSGDARLLVYGVKPDSVTITGADARIADGVYLRDVGRFGEGFLGGVAPNLTVDSATAIVENSYFQDTNVGANSGFGALDAVRSSFISAIVGSGASLFLRACHFQGSLIVGSNNTFCSARDCTINGSVGSSSGSSLDFAGCRILLGVGGAGSVERDLEHGTVTTSAGDTTVTFGTPMVTANYTIALTELGATPGAGGHPALVSKANTGFVLNEPTGGRVFEWRLVRY